MRLGVALLACLLLSALVQTAEINTNRFGSLEVTNEYDDVIEKEVYFPDDTLYHDYLSRANFMRNSLDQAKIHSMKLLKGENIMKCTDPDHIKKDDFQFLPVFVGSLFNSSQVIEYEGTCFKSLKFHMDFKPDQAHADTIQITLEATGKKSALCREAIFFSTTERHHIEHFFFAKKHVITMKNLHEDDFIDLNISGFRLFLFCDGPVDSFLEVFNTIKLFVGGLGSNPKYPFIGSHVPEYMVKENVHFVAEALGWQMEKRDVTEVEVDDDWLHDGDFLAVTRLDGLDEIIMWGTGGHIGHSTVVLTIDGVKHIIESQDAWYWPKHKIQRNTYKQWVQWAKNCDFHVSILPLKDEYRAKFNNTAAYEWFKTVEGMPYGYHNFLFSWIDTPYDNYPPNLYADFLPIVFEMFDRLMPSVMETFFLQAMNHRLNTTGLNYRQVVHEAESRGISMIELVAQPEIDGWWYSDGYSYVCSCFVIGVYKAAGLFGDMYVNAVEFTPKDVYQLAVFNTTAELPSQCTEADPDLPYCQILGKYKMTLPGYSTIEPYTHMNENCPSIAKEYIRPDGC